MPGLRGNWLVCGVRGLAPCGTLHSEQPSGSLRGKTRAGSTGYHRGGLADAGQPAVRAGDPGRNPLWLVRAEVQIAGYMIPVAPSQAQGKVTHFLLVPDPGDWLNPPHMHAGEVIDVRMKDGQTTQLVERTAITVCGRLSLGSMNSLDRAILFLADATVGIMQE